MVYSVSNDGDGTPSSRKPGCLIACYRLLSLFLIKKLCKGIKKKFPRPGGEELGWTNVDGMDEHGRGVRMMRGGFVVMYGSGCSAGQVAQRDGQVARATP